MPTIRYLLDRYGQPPADVALDWAWQIRQRLATHHHGGDNCLLELEQWTQLEVAEDGQLQCEELRAEVALAALDDLRYWAGDTCGSGETTQADTTNIANQLVSTTEAEQLSGLVQSPQTIQTSRCTARSRAGSRLSVTVKTKCIAAAGVLLCASLLLIANFRSPRSAPTERPLATASSSQNAPPVELEPSPDPAQLDTSSLLNAQPEVDRQPFQDVPSDSGAKAVLGQLSLDASLSSDSSLGLSPSLPLASRPDEVSDASANMTSQPSPAHQAAAKPVDTSTMDTAASVSESDKPSDAMREVQQTLQKAEATESIAVANRGRGAMFDAPGEPWVLLRDTMRYRVTLSPKLNVSRMSQWTLALEPVAGLAVEPQRPVTIAAQGVALWRIYETDAKSPRACLLVRALHHGRDGTLELAFYGGAEDLPSTTVPLAQRWLAPLTVRVQSQALELRGALAQLSTTVITRDQVPAVMQRKQAMMLQMLSSARLGAVLPEINRLVELVDGQVTMHAELRSKPDEPAIATWGRLPRQ